MNKINLEEFAGGALQEQFNDAMGKVLVNMQDLNTSFKAKREITVKVTFTQDEQRENVKVNVSTTTKLANAMPVETLMAVGKNLKTGEIVAEEYGRQIRGQQKFDPETGEILEENVPHEKIEIPVTKNRIVKAVEA